ncbi:MAG: hypothetical protein AAF802_15330 [Planctomycetota bacterium]
MTVRSVTPTNEIVSKDYDCTNGVTRQMMLVRYHHGTLKVTSSENEQDVLTYG